MFARRLFVFTILGLFVCAAASLLWAADDKTAALESKLQKLLGERVETAMEGVAANEAAYNAGTVTLDSLIQSREDLVKARLALAKTAAEREIALKENAQGLRHREDEIAKLYESGARGGEANAMAMITVARQTAEIRLLEEQLRNAKEAN